MYSFSCWHLTTRSDIVANCGNVAIVHNSPLWHSRTRSSTLVSRSRSNRATFD